MNQTCLVANQVSSGCCKLREVVAESGEQFYFLQQYLYTLCVNRLKANSVVFNKGRNSRVLACVAAGPRSRQGLERLRPGNRVWADSHVILSNQRSVKKSKGKV